MLLDATPQASFTIPEIYYILATLGGLAWCYIDLRIRLTKVESFIKEQRELNEKTVLEKNVMSKEFQLGQTRIYDKIDVMKEEMNKNINGVLNKIGDVNVYCAGHDSRTAETVLKMLKDYDIIKVK